MSQREISMSHVVRIYGGFYFACVMNLYSEWFLLNGTSLGVTFGTGRGGKEVTPKTVPFNVSVLAVVTNKVETAIWNL